jgi:hypothetical protein
MHLANTSRRRSGRRGDGQRRTAVTQNGRGSRRFEFPVRHCQQRRAKRSNVHGTAAGISLPDASIRMGLVGYGATIARGQNGGGVQLEHLDGFASLYAYARESWRWDHGNHIGRCRIVCIGCTSVSVINLQHQPTGQPAKSAVQSRSSANNLLAIWRPVAG